MQEQWKRYQIHSNGIVWTLTDNAPMRVLRVVTSDKVAELQDECNRLNAEHDTLSLQEVVDLVKQICDEKTE